MGREQLVDVLMEEYRTLRQESLDTLGHRLTVVSFTFAALSVVVAGMLTAPELPPWVIGTVGVVFVPQAAKAGLFIWLGEYQRSQRAGRHLAGIERRINALLDVDDDTGLCWESALTSQGGHMSTPYIATIAFTLGAGWTGAGLGLYFLWRTIAAAWPAPWHGVALTSVAVVLVVWEALVVRRFVREWRAARQRGGPADT